jgi:hypothetical protein
MTSTPDTLIRLPNRADPRSRTTPSSPHLSKISTDRWRSGHVSRYRNSREESCSLMQHGDDGSNSGDWSQFAAAHTDEVTRRWQSPPTVSSRTSETPVRACGSTCPTSKSTIARTR